jgi:hypothetical protein
MTTIACPRCGRLDYPHVCTIAGFPAITFVADERQTAVTFEAVFFSDEAWATR